MIKQPKLIHKSLHTMDITGFTWENQKGVRKSVLGYEYQVNQIIDEQTINVHLKIGGKNKCKPLKKSSFFNAYSMSICFTADYDISNVSTPDRIKFQINEIPNLLINDLDKNIRHIFSNLGLDYSTQGFLKEFNEEQLLTLGHEHIYLIHEPTIEDE